MTKPPYSWVELVVVACREYDDDDADYEMDEINPDHPALARVQAALKRQILTQKQRLEAEIREKVCTHCRACTMVIPRIFLSVPLSLFLYPA